MKKFIMQSALSLVLSVSGLAQQTSEMPGNGKKMGIAVNPVLMLFEWGSAEINFWNISRSAEINLPINYAHNPFFIDDKNDGEGNTGLDVKIFSAGLYYRYFFNEKQKGFYAQAGWLYLGGSAAEGGRKVTGSQNSILFGFGYRLISPKGLFWGCALGVGRAWGSLQEPDGDEVRGSGLTLDIDFLKFGYAW